jgi:hypothetical protein
MQLIKLSMPGWEKEFSTEDECKAELYNYICTLCCKGTEFREYKVPPIDANSSLDAMLSSACGCEFMVE